MDSLLNVEPGLLFWSIVNFLFFLLVLYLIGAKNFIKNITNRENLIQNALDSAEEKKATMERLVKENEQKLLEAQKTIDDMLKKAKEQSAIQGQQIIDEAKKQKESIINDATAEIEINKKAALMELRRDVAGMVMSATEIIIEEKLDKEKDKQLIEKHLNEISVN